MAIDERSRRILAWMLLVERWLRATVPLRRQGPARGRPGRGRRELCEWDVQEEALKLSCAQGRRSAEMRNCTNSARPHFFPVSRPEFDAAKRVTRGDR